MSFWKKNKIPHIIEVSRRQDTTHGQDSAQCQPTQWQPGEEAASSSDISIENSNSVCFKPFEQRFGTVKSALGAGAEIEGKLSFDIPVKIDGKLTGELYSSQVVIIGQSAEIFAKIESPVLVVFGKINGSVKAREKVELQAGSYLEADVTTPSLIVAEGAVFNGRTSQ